MTKELDDVAFVNAWVDAYKKRLGLKGMCELHKLVYVEASQRASKLRRAGVKLPTMPHANQKRVTLEVNVPSLNKIIIAELGEQALGWRNR